jgi:low affinity Fe/Cu permease
MNTVNSIVTFLMVFLIQNMENRDTREIHLKLDELIPLIRRHGMSVRISSGFRTTILRKWLESIDTSDLSGLRDRALIGAIGYTFRG